MNGLGELTGEGIVQEPLTDNELNARVVYAIAGVITVFILSLLTYNIWVTSAGNDIAKYAIDHGAWTCGYDQKGLPICQPRFDKK
jgi:hypothetical protein